MSKGLIALILIFAFIEQTVVIVGTVWLQYLGWSRWWIAGGLFLIFASSPSITLRVVKEYVE